MEQGYEAVRQVRYSHSQITVSRIYSPDILCFADYPAIMVIFACGVYYTVKLLKMKRKNTEVNLK